jgi:hypothetical protein
MRWGIWLQEEGRPTVRSPIRRFISTHLKLGAHLLDTEDLAGGVITE